MPQEGRFEVVLDQGFLNSNAGRWFCFIVGLIRLKEGDILNCSVAIWSVWGVGSLDRHYWGAGEMYGM